MEIIGISGPPCSGKDVAAEYIAEQYGYSRVSTGDLLRARARELNIELGRTSLQLLGTRLRAENGGEDPLLSLALREAKVNTVFTGIRTVKAAESIISENGRLLYVDAPVARRYKRSIERDRADHSTYEEFIAQDKVEHLGSNDIDTSLLSIRSIASMTIINDGSLHDYLRHVDNFVTNTQ